MFSKRKSIMNDTYAASCYSYALLIKHLWHTPLNCNPHQQIVSADKLRYDYAGLYDRINRLASGLAEIGVKPGNNGRCNELG